MTPDRYALSRKDVIRVGGAVVDSETLSREKRNVTPLPSDGVRQSNHTPEEAVLWPTTCDSNPITTPSDLVGYCLGKFVIPNDSGGWDKFDCFVRPAFGQTLALNMTGLGKLVGWRDAADTYSALPIYCIVAASPVAVIQTSGSDGVSSAGGGATVTLATITIPGPGNWTISASASCTLSSTSASTSGNDSTASIYASRSDTGTLTDTVRKLARSELAVATIGGTNYAIGNYLAAGSGAFQWSITTTGSIDVHLIGALATSFGAGVVFDIATLAVCPCGDIT